MSVFSRVSIAAILCVSGIAKLLGDAGPGALLSGWTAVAVAVLELALAAMILLGILVWPSSCVVLGIAAAGSVLALVFPHVACGCFGKMIMGPAVRLGLSATLGICSLLLMKTMKSPLRRIDLPRGL